MDFSAALQHSRQGSATALQRRSNCRVDSPNRSRCGSPQPRSRRNSITTHANAAMASPTRQMQQGHSSGVVSPLAAVEAALAGAARGAAGVQGPAGAQGAAATKAPPRGELGWATDFSARYQLGKCIGSGAFGTVHLAIDRRSGQEVAVKIMSKTRAKQTRDKTVAKLKREADVLTQLAACPNAIALLDQCEDDSFVYLVMEHCAGGDLEKMVEDHGCLDEEQTALVLYECLKVLDSLHATNTVHGDVKPANFLLKQRIGQRGAASIRDLAARGDCVRAIDFGCSQTVAADQMLMRRTGTPVFMAPEVYNRNYNWQADMWSLGMMMYHFMTCRFPFWQSMAECRSSTLEDVMKAITIGAIPLDEGPFAQMSGEGMDLLKRLLQRDPQQRITARQALAHPWFARFGAAGATQAAPPEKENVAAAVNQPALPQQQQRPLELLRTLL